MQHSLPVPPAFVVTAYAYRAHVARADVNTAITAARSAPLTDRAARSAVARAAIMAAPLDPELGRAIAAVASELGAGLFAVRSSASSEDTAGHSFAGQYDTILGVVGVDACCDAVRRCWASLWNERAIAYRDQNDPVDDPAMAVVIQCCIAADAAGVLFTCDPITNRADRIVIEGVFGLGESLVSGRLAPDRWVIDKATNEMVDERIAQKPFEIVADGTGGTRERPLPPKRTQTPCLTPAQRERLVELAVATERAFGGAQDIEWAIDGGEVVLLQARPVTTGRASIDPADRQVWANTNTGEILPDVLTPMTFSVLNRLFDALVRHFFSRLAFDLEGKPFLALIAGRAYFNMNTLVSVLSGVPFIRLNATQLFGGDPQLAAALAELTPNDFPASKVSRWQFLARVPADVFWLLRHVNVRGESELAALRATTAKLEGQDLTTLTDAALLARLWDAFADVNTFVEAFTHAAVGLACSTQLAVVCKRWFADADGAIASRLLSGVGDLDSAEAGLDLWRLAEAAHTLPPATVFSGASFDGIRPALAGDAAGREFLVRWDRFMAQHGHHTRVEVDVAVPRWREQPEYLLGLLRSYIGAESTNPVDTHRRRAAERAALTRDCERRLGAARRRVFNGLLARAQRGTALRENVKSEAVRRVAIARATLLEIGSRLATRGTLAERDDVFFVDTDELAAIMGGDSRFDPRVLVSQRRSEFTVNLALTPLAVIVGCFDPRRHVVAPQAGVDSRSMLRGLAVSPGRVSGRARVILRADCDERVLPGEILIAPFTDPGWTPYFLQAAAIVMDLGGVLSHGSIVAREYGIPAVVNVGPATRVIHTGDLVEVDGYLGEVRVLQFADGEGGAVAAIGRT